MGLIMIYKRYSITKDQRMVASFGGIEKNSYVEVKIDLKFSFKENNDTKRKKKGLFQFRISARCSGNSSLLVTLMYFLQS